MTDRIWTTAEPLTEAEERARFNCATTVTIKHSAERHAIRKEWVRGSAEDNALYGYAERRTTTTDEATALELTVSHALNVVDLTRVILEEIRRQETMPARIEVAGALRDAANNARFERP